MTLMLENKITTSKKVELELKDRGIKKIWLADQLGIARQTLDIRLRDNFWTADEIVKLKMIFNW
jgi:hypothetical protein